MTPEPIRDSGGKSASKTVRKHALAWPLLGYMLLFFIVPVAIVVRGSLASQTLGGKFTGLSLAQYQGFFAEPFYLETLLWTLVLSVITVAITAAIALPFAYNLLYARKSLKFQLFALFAPLLINSVVRIFGLEFILQRFKNIVSDTIGLVLPVTYSKVAVVIGLVTFLLPMVVVPIYASLYQMDRSTVDAARTLGASSLPVMVHIVLPAARPGLTAGCILAFTGAMSSYIVPAMMGGGHVPTLSQLVFNQVNQSGQWGTASVAAMVLVVVMVPVLAVASKVGFQRGQAS